MSDEIDYKQLYLDAVGQIRNLGEELQELAASNARLINTLNNCSISRADFILGAIINGNKETIHALNETYEIVMENYCDIT